MSLKGKFFFRSGKEYSQQGEIAYHEGDVLLLKLNHGEGGDPGTSGMLTVPIFELFEEFDVAGSPTCTWQLFDTKEQLEAFLDWLDSEPVSGPKVVSIKK